jgi:hypothetical protein
MMAIKGTDDIRHARPPEAGFTDCGLRIADYGLRIADYGLRIMPAARILESILSDDLKENHSLVATLRQAIQPGRNPGIQ